MRPPRWPGRVPRSRGAQRWWWAVDRSCCRLGEHQAAEAPVPVVTEPDRHRVGQQAQGRVAVTEAGLARCPGQLFGLDGAQGGLERLGPGERLAGGGVQRSPPRQPRQVCQREAGGHEQRESGQLVGPTAISLGPPAVTETMSCLPAPPNTASLWATRCQDSPSAEAHTTTPAAAPVPAAASRSSSAGRPEPPPWPDAEGPSKLARRRHPPGGCRHAALVPVLLVSGGPARRWVRPERRGPRLAHRPAGRDASCTRSRRSGLIPGFLGAPSSSGVGHLKGVMMM